MKSVVRIIMLAVSILVLSALLVYQHIQLEATKQTVRAQQETLYDLQGEFKEQDLTLLDGETVSAAEAVSLTRKYRNKVTIIKNGSVLAPETAASKSNFTEGSNWVVTVETDANGVCTGIKFTSPIGVTKEPSSVADAKSSLASVVGGYASDTWNSLIGKVTRFVQTEEYRKRIAQLLSLGDAKDWTSIMNELDKKFGLSGTTMVDCEKITLLGNESRQYKLDRPTFCYYVNDNETGFLTFNNGTCQYFGEQEESAVMINLANKTISNDKNATIMCILFSI